MKFDHKAMPEYLTRPIQGVNQASNFNELDLILPELYDTDVLLSITRHYHKIRDDGDKIFIAKSAQIFLLSNSSGNR